VLTTDQRTELERCQRTDPRPYVRERSSALLQIADGASVRHVAVTGLLTIRDPHSVADWLNRYQATGMQGLTQAPRRARGYPP
jgi:transposase